MTPRLLTRFGDVFYAYDKPAGMAVHPTNEDIPDLVTWLHGQRALPRSLRPGHRLDRPTSGVVLCGAGRAARAQIATWLTDVEKVYIALVAGGPNDDAGYIREPLSDARRGRPLAATTEFRVLERLRGVSLLEVRLHSGRKHQIRRHLADSGWPVVGDSRYGPRRPTPVPRFPGRMWLHAGRLTVNGRCIEAPLPDELEAHLTHLRAM